MHTSRGQMSSHTYGKTLTRRSPFFCSVITPPERKALHLPLASDKESAHAALTRSCPYAPFVYMQRYAPHSSACCVRCPPRKPCEDGQAQRMTQASRAHRSPGASVPPEALTAAQPSKSSAAPAGWRSWRQPPASPLVTGRLQWRRPSAPPPPPRQTPGPGRWRRAQLPCRCWRLQALWWRACP